MKKIKLLGLLLTVTAAYAQSTSENYIQSKTCLSGDCSKREETVTYFDGLGRPKQVVGIKMTTTGKDLVTPITYDDYGRQTKDILPVPANSQNGAIHTDIVNENTANAYYGVANAFAEKEIENSPLDRVLQQAHPGDAWKMGAGHTAQYKYEVNASGEVKKFITNTTTNTVGAINNTVSSFPTVGLYDAGILYKNIVIDEEGTPVIQFTNSRGQVLLIRRTDGTQNVDTYYVYNEYGQQVFVIPPKAVQQIEQNNNELTPNILETLCYQYRYDGRGRQVEKRLPGRGDWESVVYDGADRPILSQDVNLKNKGQWLLSKYDHLGRVVYTGLLSGGSRTDMQGQIGDQIINESRTSSFIKNGLTVYYSNTFLSSFTTVLTVNYYDTYPRDNKEPIPVKILDQFVITTNKSENGGVATTSLPTATYVKNIEDDNWTYIYFYYDTKGRKISERSWNHLGGYTKTDSKLDFAGMLEERQVFHIRKSGDKEVIVSERFNYDLQNRLVQHFHMVDSDTEELLAENTYNDIGQLTNKKTGNTTGIPLQSIDYNYNIRGWVSKLNDPANLNGKLFAYELKYENPVNGSLAKYSGNIAEFDWRSAGGNFLRRYVYKYDKLNRLLDASYGEPFATTPLNDGYSEKVTYDLNGNIQTLKRYQPLANIPILIDNLNYQIYDGNKLKKVTDENSNPSGYPTGGNTIGYDANGNMIDHLDKGISAISYNFLNLPTEVKLGVKDRLNFLYRADGIKLKYTYSYYIPQIKTVQTKNTEYLNGFQYVQEEGGASLLQFFPTAEGYYDFQKKRYIYNYQDHLGNIRLAYYRGSNNEAVTDRETGYYPFGMEYAGYNPTQLQSYTYGFQEQERQKETGWSSFKWRNSIPELGRFFNVDPLAESYSQWSTYAFSGNRVVDARELEGLEPEQVNKSSLPDDPMEFAEFIAGGFNSVRAAVSNSVGRTINVLTNDAVRNKYEVEENGSLTLRRGVPKESFKEKAINGAFDLATIGMAALGGPQGVFTAKGGKAPALKGIEEIKAVVKLSGKERAAAEGRVIAKRGSFRKQTVKDAWNNAADGTKPNTKACPTCKKNVKGNPNNGEKRSGPDGWDVSHNPSWVNRNHDGMTRKEQLDNYNSGTDLECFGCNRSAKDNDSRFHK